MDESDLITEFMKISKCDRADAISCLSAWGYDLKKALIDYNGKAQKPCWPDSFMHLIQLLQIHQLKITSKPKRKPIEKKLMMTSRRT